MEQKVPLGIGISAQGLRLEFLCTLSTDNQLISLVSRASQFHQVLVHLRISRVSRLQTHLDIVVQTYANLGFSVIPQVTMDCAAVTLLRRMTQRPQMHQSRHEHSEHGHASENRTIATAHSLVELSIFEQGEPPRFRLAFDTPPPMAGDDSVDLETLRPNGARQ
jgi:hypothetical protein